VTSVGTAKAGTFSEGAARVVAASLIAELQGGEQPPAYAGAGTCYIEFGGDRVGRVDVDFLSGPSPTGSFTEPSVALAGDKQHFGSSRRARCSDFNGYRRTTRRLVAGGMVEKGRTRRRS